MTTRIVPTSLSCNACASLPATERCPERCPRNFVMSGWSSSLASSRDAGMITADDWTRVMHEQIAKICARPECKVMLAVDQVYQGFIAGEPDERIVYYVYVKELYRRQGLARQLFKALGIEPDARFAYPCEAGVLTAASRARMGVDFRRKIPRAVFDQAVARYPKGQRHRSYT